MKTENTNLFNTTLAEEFVYVGNNNVDYPGRAELKIDESGNVSVSAHDYFDDNRWIGTEDRDWDKKSIESTFAIKLI